MGKILNLAAALAFSACSTGATPDRPGLNNNDPDLGRESSDAGVEEGLDLGNTTDSVPDAPVEKRCVSLMGCLFYHGSSDGLSPNRDYFLGTHPQIMDNYRGFIERDVLSVTYNGFAHSWAEGAAECARNQGESEFLRYLTYLFENQEEWAHATSSELFKEYAQFLVENPSYGEELYGRVRLNTKDFNRCVDGQETDKAVWAGIRECEERGVYGTPTVFVNEREILGAQPYEVFARAINEELEECGLLENRD